MPSTRSITHNIFIGKNVYSSLSDFLKKEKYSRVYILCDENTMRLCLPNLVLNMPDLASAEIMELESGEVSKSPEVAINIWRTLIESNADKQSLLINLGGGVVSDIGGFCASTYKRGIDFINLPTTLLAMADASVGGKNGININDVKNCVGTITQPRAIFINPYFLKTLDKRHYYNGLAEIYKLALISDKSFWKKLTGESLDEETLILKSVSIKNKIVKADPFENGQRKILNFGHTIGHAIESAMLKEGYDLLHGEAVLSGMIIESHISFQLKMINKKQLDEILKAFKETFTLKALNIDTTLLMPYLLNDKKSSGNKILFALVNGIGSCKINIEVKAPMIGKAIDYYTRQLK
jgi:3-dehydroquinate synthase